MQKRKKIRTQIDTSIAANSETSAQNKMVHGEQKGFRRQDCDRHRGRNRYRQRNSPGVFAGGSKVVINGRREKYSWDAAHELDPGGKRIAWVAGDVGLRRIA